MQPDLSNKPKPIAATPVAASADARFDTAHLTKNLNARMAKGGSITMGVQIVKLVIRLTSGAILARLLAPADFGLVALVTFVTGFVELFKDAGLSMATIQRKNLLQAQVSALFWINVGLAVVIMTLEMLLAPVVAWFYNDPRLTTIMIALASLTVFGGMSVQHLALLRRNMQFGRIASIEILSQLVGVLVAITMAIHGFGYWSLLGLTAGMSLTTLILSFSLSGWIPSWPSRAEGVGDMVKFGSNLAGASFFNYFTRHADNFVVGFLQGPAVLGIYSRAYSLFLMPLQQFLAPVSAVVIPALARATDNPAQFRQIVLEKSYFVLFFVVLATGVSFTAAPELVRILLGPAWTDAVPIVRCLAIGGAIYGTNIAGSWVSSTRGSSYRQLRVAVIAGPLYAVSYFIGGYFFGAIGVASAFSITCALLRYPVFRYLLKDSPVTPGELIVPLIKVGGANAIAVALALLLVTRIPDPGLIYSLAIKLGCFGSIIAFFCISKVLKLPKISRTG